MKFRHIWIIILIVGVLISTFMIGYYQAELDNVKTLRKAVNTCNVICGQKSIQMGDNAEYFKISCKIGCYDTGLYYLQIN